MDVHQFEHEGHIVNYVPASVRSEMKRYRYLQALITAHGYENGEDVDAKDPEEWQNFLQYSSGMSQCQTDAAWWVGSMASAHAIKAAYECFLDQGTELYHKFVAANSATLLPKKTILSTSET